MIVLRGTCHYIRVVRQTFDFFEYLLHGLPLTIFNVLPGTDKINVSVSLTWYQVVYYCTSNIYSTIVTFAYFPEVNYPRW